MAESLGKALLELAADGTGLKGDLDSAEQKVRASADLMQAALASIGIGFSLKAVIDATIEAEKESALLAAAVKATGASAGYTTEQLKAQQVVLQKTTGIGDEAISSMQRTLMSFRNVHGEVFKSAIQVSLDFAAATGGDATEAARKFGMALNDPVNNMGLLKKAGVALSDTLKAQVEDLVKNGDLIGAQTLLVGELAKTYNGAAVAARDTLGGALNALKENFGNLFLEQEGAGKQLRIFIELINQSLMPTVVVLSTAFASVKYYTEGMVTNLFKLGEALYYFAQAAVDQAAVAANLLMGNLIGARLAFSEMGRDLVAAKDSFLEIKTPIQLAAQAAAAGAVAHDEAAASMRNMSAASAALAASAPINAGIVKQSAQEMATALNVARLAEEAKNAALVSSAQANFAIFQQQSAIKTAAIAAEGLLETDSVRQKYATMAAEADIYYQKEALNLQTSALGYSAYLESMLALGKSKEERMSAIKKASDAAQAKQDKAESLQRLANISSTFGTISTLSQSHNSTMAAIGKSAGIAQATVDTYIGANRALALGPIIGPPLAALVVAAGMANVARIAGVRGLETGGPMAAGETALVGEGGPELFTAPRAGHIIPNGEFGGGGGGRTTVNLAINVAGIDFSSESTAERILMGIADAARRGVESAIPAANAFSELSAVYGGRA